MVRERYFAFFPSGKNVGAVRAEWWNLGRKTKFAEMFRISPLKKVNLPLENHCIGQHQFYDE